MRSRLLAFLQLRFPKFWADGVAARRAAALHLVGGRDSLSAGSNSHFQIRVPDLDDDVTIGLHAGHVLPGCWRPCIHAEVVRTQMRKSLMTGAAGVNEQCMLTN